MRHVVVLGSPHESLVHRVRDSGSRESLGHRLDVHKYEEALNFLKFSVEMRVLKQLQMIPALPLPGWDETVDVGPGLVTALRLCRFAPRLCFLFVVRS